MKSLSQMTEEELKTLCKSLESRYGENSTITVKQSDFNNMWASIDRYAKENQRLQEQLKEANDLLKGLYDDSPCQFDHCGYCQEHGSTDGNYICVQGELKEYLKKWGVK